MRYHIALSLLLLNVALVGCTTPKQAILPALRIIDFPQIGEERSAELGDTLLRKGKETTYEAILLENSVTAGDGFLLKKISLQPGTLRASFRDNQRIYYTTPNLAVFDALLGTQMHFGGLAIHLKNDDDIVFHTDGRPGLPPNQKPIFTKTQVADLERPSFRQELIYNGRSGDTLKFLYREFSSDVLRAPFSQEVQYDLKEAQTIGFKGARIEVIEATNTLLKYRVHSTFPDAL